VLLHPPPLAREFSASYGEMSRRSGVAAKEDNHSDISPFRINRLRAVEHLIIAHARSVELSTSIALRFSRLRA